jgi:D-glycero-alpha-D-manno-heptose-7-phosphate kinase
MKHIQISSPTRVDLAGGTLDLWPLYNFVGGAQTINVAIDIMTRVDLKERSDLGIKLVSKDLNLEKEYSNLQEALNDSDERLSLLKVHLHYWKPNKGFELSTSSESPVGGGLGGSSSLTVSLLKAFAQFCERPFKNTHELVHVAHNLEAAILNTPTGTQDYYPAASGGINILSYRTSGIQQTVLSIEESPLKEHFILVNTGRSHHSGLNNFEVLTAAVKKDEKVLSALKSLKNVADQTVDAVTSKNWALLPDLFQQELKYRLQLTPAFSSPEIEKLIELSLQAGASAVKICGAGGGGCVLVWAQPDKRAGVIDRCQKAGFQVLSAKPAEVLGANPL